MEGNVVAIYKKIKLFENFYIYKFIEAVENVEYDAFNDTIQYVKKGKIKVVSSMEDPLFTISDEKYCFSDFLDKSELKGLYDTDETDVLGAFIQGCCSFIRYGILDPERESLKIVDSSLDSIIEAKPDSHYYEYALDFSLDSELILGIPMTVAEMILSNIENGNIEEVKEFFQMAISDGIMETNEIDDEIPSKLLEEKEITEENIDYLQKLNSLIGLDMIKRQVIKLENYLKFRDKVSQQILLEQLNLNMVFMGNPGTGKTSVARIMANMFYKMGYAKKNMVAELTVRDFVAEYVGQTAIKTQKVLNKYKGGVIFIDEAYVFCSDGQEFGDEALVEIIKEMEKRETIFIFAGYKDEMEKFIKMNPGLQSRIGYHLEFPDYTLDELYAIFLRKVKMSKLYIADEMGAKVKLLISDFMKKKHFGNGCFIDNLFDKILLSHANRCWNDIDMEKLITLTEEDVNVEVKEELKTGEKTKRIGF